MERLDSLVLLLILVGKLWVSLYLVDVGCELATDHFSLLRCVPFIQVSLGLTLGCEGSLENEDCLPDSLASTVSRFPGRASGVGIEPEIIILSTEVLESFVMGSAY